MKSNSSIYPSSYFKSQGLIYIVDLSTVVESEIIQDNSDSEIPTITKSYTYEQYELPITDRDNLSEYIEHNYEMLIEFAKVKQIERDIAASSPNETDKLWDAITYMLTSEY